MVLVVIWLTLVALWAFSLIDGARRPREQWEAVGRSKGAWLLLLVLAGWFASIFYLLVIRRKMKDAVPKVVPRPRRAREKTALQTVPRRKEDWGDPWADT